ncbi:MAG: adenosylcobinamide-phosphate synthase CbiB [Mangrovibacterium sp.]
MEINLHMIALLAGFLLDKLLGDPGWLPHPVTWFGQSISFCEKKLNRQAHLVFKGALVVFFLVSLVFILAFVLITSAYQANPYFGVFVEAAFIFYGLAGTTLIREGKAVFERLEESLPLARVQLSRIVGRETSALSRNQICAATLETLAENLSDGVVAPLFWYAIAGIPGMMAYKMVNTLDSMIGYKNEQYLYFGRIAARLDDCANFIPARITALLMALCNGSTRAFHFIFKFGRAHSSPNAGYPEAALAGILDVRFGGCHTYFGKPVEKPWIGYNNRDFIWKDLSVTVKTNRLTELCMILFLLLMMYFNLIPMIDLYTV